MSPLLSNPLLTGPVFSVALTLLVFQLARALYTRLGWFILNPVLVSIVTLIALLKLLGLDYQTYHQGGRLISFFLGPAVVALGLPLYQQLPTIQERGRSILFSILVGSVVGVTTAGLTALLLGAPPQVVASLAPKSITTPMAMGVAQTLGGIPPLTAALVVAAGVLGAVLGPPFLRLCRVTGDTAFGLAMGAAAHGIGTARALEEGELAGATSGLAICLNGLATALVTPPLMKLFYWLVSLF
ncbi:MAG: LrgB family protein [Deltaproteobacteria bacterium]|nr:LrgB family protein [Deltaproteobacteria bacterium]